MPESASPEWSPSDGPQAIATSRAMWWLSAVRLSVARINTPREPGISLPDPRQIDARFLVIALAQLLAAESLAQKALAASGANDEAKAALSHARDLYLEALPGLQEMRNALMHPEDWALGTGRGEQKAFVEAGASVRTAAAHFWGFSYHPTDRAITMGPYRLKVDAVTEAATNFHWAIYRAARLSRSVFPEFGMDS